MFHSNEEEKLNFNDEFNVLNCNSNLNLKTQSKTKSKSKCKSITKSNSILIQEDKIENDKLNDDNYVSLDSKSSQESDLDLDLIEKLNNFELLNDKIENNLNQNNFLFDLDDYEMNFKENKHNLNFFTKNRIDVIEEDEDEDNLNEDKNLFKLTLNNNLNQTNKREEEDSLDLNDSNKQSEVDCSIISNLNIKTSPTCLDENQCNNKSIDQKLHLNTRNCETQSEIAVDKLNDGLIKEDKLNSCSQSTISMCLNISQISTNSISLNSSNSQSITDQSQSNSLTKTSLLVNNVLKKGFLCLWQANKHLTSSTSFSSNSLKNNAKRIFFSIHKERKWKTRFWMLTENYLLCFRKGAKSDIFSSRMGKFLFKLNLLEDIKTIKFNLTSLNGKPHCLELNEGSILLFDKDVEQLEQWLNLILVARQQCEKAKNDQIAALKKQKEEQNNSKSSSQFDLNLSQTKSNQIQERVEDINTSHNSDATTLQHLKKLKKQLTGAVSSIELNTSSSNINQIKTNTPVISNRKRMSFQRKSLLSQFDSFLSCSNNISNSNKPNIENKVNLTNFANLMNASVNNPITNNSNQTNLATQIEDLDGSPSMLPRIAPQCQGTNANGKLLTNSCSAFHFGTNPRSLPYAPFTLNNSPALTQRSLYAEQILSNSSLTLSNFSSKSSRHSIFSSSNYIGNHGLFATSTFLKPLQASIHYATSLRSNNANFETKSHLKSATSEFSFIRLSNLPSSSTLSKQINSTTINSNNTLKKESKNLYNSNVNHLNGNKTLIEDYLGENSDAESDYENNTLRNKTSNLNCELSKRTIILNATNILGQNDPNSQVKSNSLIKQESKKINDKNRFKKINNSLDESDSPSNSSSCSSNNLLINNNNLNVKNENLFNSANKSFLFDNKNIKDNYIDNFSFQAESFDFDFLRNEKNLNKNRSSKDANHKLNKKENLRINANVKQTNELNLNSNSNQANNNQVKLNTTNEIRMRNKCNNKSQGKNSNCNQASSNKQIKKRNSTSLIPVSKARIDLLDTNSNYQTCSSVSTVASSVASTEKRKTRMNKILENQSKIYVTAADLK